MSKDELSANRQSLQTEPLMGLGSIAAGTVLGWTGNITEELKNGEFNDIEITDFDLKWIGSFATLGAMFMCFPSGIMCEKLGRKLSMLTLTVPFIVGWLLIIFANSVEMIYIGRFLTGMVIGAFLPLLSLYIGEIAEKEIRGALVILAGVVTLGIMLAYIIAYMVNPKLYTIIVATLPLLFMITFLFQPETPVYSMKQGREAEARATLIRLRGSSYDIDAEIKEIKAVIEKDKENQTSFKDSITKTSTKKAAAICFSLMFFQQAGGINAVIFYTSDIFLSSGAKLDPKLAAIVVGALQFIPTFFSIPVIDRIGRRMLFLVSNLVMGVGLIILGVFFTLSERQFVNSQTLANLGFMPLLGLSLFIIAFPLGSGPVPWIMSAELFPPGIKGLAVAATSTFNWFIAFIITNFYFNIKEAIGGDVTFYVFSAVCFIGAAFAIFAVPETKGKSLYQIQIELTYVEKRVT
ncbi:hypothetical protein ILUMI_22918 [Ignelater luminosus]|uniref:Major facilitator superfamily (MFS) profile domain-containing protein n=1 Tax=Ignelater luminosus TaxID=2038154 RepID=A0A8K0CEU9_IGNLU|nr:hypothetical protein ILUMI_22918 [Ignelater luminosus]